MEHNKDTDGRYSYSPSSLFSFPQIKKYIRRYLSNGHGHGILDIGCGKGFFLHLTLTQYPELSTMMIFAGQQGETSVAALKTSLYITVMQLSFCDTLIMIPFICTIPLTKTH